jgi:signal transduction histidine kinase/HAMP domain-containing protein
MISEAQQLVEFSGERARHYVERNEEAFAFSRFVTLLFAGAIFLLVVSLLVIIQVSVLKPLYWIGGMINQVQNGNLDARVDVQSPYELGRVAEQLNSFAASLAAKLRKLVEINGELELEVKQKETSKKELYSVLKELQVTQNVLEGAGRMCGVGGWHIDLKTNQLIWSRQIYSIVEAPPNYVPTIESVIELYEGEAKQIISEKLQRCRDTGEKLDVELPFVTFTGRHIWVQVYGELIFESQGSEKVAVAIAGAFQDITLRRKQESELKASIQAAESASLAKGDFLANMSHEIRTPLNAVVGLGYMLRKTALSGDQLSILDKLEMSARTLIGLVSDILDFSKIEAGSMELDSEVTDASKFFDTLGSISAGLPISSDVDLLFELDKRIPDRWVIDGLKLKQILLNLLSNAAKFTSAGQVSLACKVIDLNNTHAQLRFEVSDTGIGMNEEVQSRLFQPFCQGESSISRRFGGTGVGLSI